MIRVLVADDSALMRQLVSNILSSEKDISVIGTARNGREAIAKALELKPDVITMDIEMPEMNGAQATLRIMSENPTPIVILSAHDENESRETIKAMEAGAVDFVKKPSGEISADLDSIQKEIIRKVRLASGARIRRAEGAPVLHRSVLGSGKILIIGASTGGPQSIETLLVSLPPDLPVPVLVVQHMPELFTREFANRLDSVCRIKVKEAEEGDPVEKSVVLIAPGASHMIIRQVGEDLRVFLSSDEPRHGVRPSIDVLFESVAPIFAAKTIAAVLTGMGSDGTAGCRAVREHGGRVVVQDPSSCIIPSMPQHIIDAGLADYVVPLESVSETLVKLLGENGQ